MTSAKQSLKSRWTSKDENKENKDEVKLVTGQIENQGRKELACAKANIDTRVLRDSIEGLDKQGVDCSYLKPLAAWMEHKVKQQCGKELGRP